MGAVAGAGSPAIFPFNRCFQSDHELVEFLMICWDPEPAFEIDTSFTLLNLTDGSNTLVHAINDVLTQEDISLTREYGQ